MNQVGVYRLYKLGRLTGSSFDTSIKVLERELHPIHHEYAEKINSQSSINGLLYELDEKATKLYWDKKPYDTVKEYVKFEEVDETYGIVTKKTIEEADLEIKEANKIIVLREEYAELSGKKAHHLWKEEKLIELIDKLKN
jgi:hypothetical protein